VATVFGLRIAFTVVTNRRYSESQRPLPGSCAGTVPDERLNTARLVGRAGENRRANQSGQSRKHELDGVYLRTLWIVGKQN